ncbi:MAG: 4-alpha-glucanotransferase [Candidatus Omnitrophica bacterium]|nr:4-alpha-glucanotransferase [Candidatus Omnitrophota bacterium]
MEEILFNSASKDKWQSLGVQRRAGVLAPLSCVYSKDSLGIGDLLTLRLVVDWAKSTEQSIVQLLPMNEMGYTNCPYDAVSSFALEPAYLSLEAFKSAQTKEFKVKIEDTKRAFPCARPYLDYRIKEAKGALLKEIFLKEKNRHDAQLSHFQEDNLYWLKDFALYKVLKRQFSGRPWYDWEEPYRFRDKGALLDFQKEHEDEIAFTIWMQWQIFRQFKQSKAYANSRRVLIKGDLPILVSRDSADVWQHPEFFKLEFASGAPPDMYCARGQRWGMPPYNWEKIAGDGYIYLKERLRYAENFYDILRIDHVVGLFRIWTIPYNEPLENQGLNGFFDPRDENKWKEHGKNILSLVLDNTRMLLCAEDLGVIPKTCTESLTELGIPGNDVQRWAKDWKTKHDFLEPKEYRAISAAMLSTHDTTNWLAWWENEAGTVDEALFIRKCAGRADYNNIKDKLFDMSLSRHGRLRWLSSVDSVDKLVGVLGRKGSELMDFVEMYQNSYREKEKLWKKMGLAGPMREKGDAEILAAALRIVMNSKSIFSIQLITDYLGLTDILKGDPYQYRINTPGTTSDKNWSLIMPIPLEDLLQHPVNSQIRQMVIDSGRA